jgi:RecB family exonuclease
MSNAIDERGGLPSASSMQRIIECPASLPLTNRLRAEGVLPADWGSQDADRGTRIHALLAAYATGLSLPKADPDEAEEALKLWMQTQHLIEQTFGDDPAGVEMVIEERIWLENSNGQRIASGQFDFIAVDAFNNRALVIDYKTGRGEVSPAAENYQLFFAAVVIREVFDVSNIRGAIIQTGAAANVADYQTPDLDFFLEQIDTALARQSRDPFEVGFRPSESRCKYCPARLVCPRLHYDLAQVEASPLAIIASATNEQLADFLAKLESVKPLEKAARAEAEGRIKAGATVPGWVVESSAGKRQVTDSAELCRVLIDAGASVADVLSAVSIPVGKAEKIYAEAAGLKGKYAREAFEEVTAALIEKSQPEPTLKRA